MSDVTITSSDGAAIIATGDTLAAGDTVVLLDRSSPIAAVFTLRRDGVEIVLRDGLGSPLEVFHDVEAALLAGLERVRKATTDARALLYLNVM